MGRPKALLPWFGRRMVDHVVALLAPCVDELLVVTSAELAPRVFAGLGGRTEPGAGGRPSLRCVVDAEPDRGPLAALRDGLDAMRAELAFATTTDAPFLTATHVEALLRAAVAGRRDGDGEDGAGPPRAIVPRADGFLQVLSAVYPRSAGREAAALLAAGIASPAALVERIDAQIRELGATGGATSGATSGPSPWTGFNTPAEYLALARHRDPAATARVVWRSDVARASAEDSPAEIARDVPIGRLDEVLRAAAKHPGAAESALREKRLRIVLAEGELEPDFDGALPIGPGERVVVHERGPGPAAPRPSR
jgi:molybdopterin-guanine dinucleotide biosynthesis protein A